MRHLKLQMTSYNNKVKTVNKNGTNPSNNKNPYLKNI